MSATRPIDLLRTIRPFAALSDEVRRAVLDQCELVTLPAGASLITSGEVPRALSMVVAGQLRVLDGHHQEQSSPIDVLGGGAMVGESLLDSAPAPFSVHTIADCELLQLSDVSLARLVAAEPQFEAAIREHLAWRAVPDRPMPARVVERAGAGAEPHVAPPDAVDQAAPAADAGSRRSLRETIAPFATYVRPLYPIIGELIAVSVIMQLLALLLPIFARLMVDDVVARADGRWLEPALLAIAGVLLLYFLAATSRGYLADFIARQVDARVVADVYKHLLRLPMRFFETRQAGDVVGTFDDLGRVTEFVTRAGIWFFIDLVTAVLYVALMAHYNGWLTALAVGLVAAEVATLFFVTPYLQRGFGTFARQEVDSDSLLIESLAGLKTIKMLATEPFVRWRMHNRLARMANTSLATLKYRTISRVVTDIVTGVGMLSVLLIGTIFVLDGRMTIGELVAFGMLTHGLTAPFAQLVTVWDTVQSTARSVQRVHDVLSHPAETASRPSPDQLVLHRLQGHVRFEAVSFRYPDTSVDVLRDVSFECYGGQRIAILGRSGSGKSTLVRLLLGLQSPSSGEISIDGSPLSEIWLPALRRQMGAVLQDTVLFRGSIRDNISHTMPSAPLGEVVAAATLVNAHRFVAALPAGYDTQLEENGANLSGGQRQQIAIARALLHLPGVIVLDEATSSVDNESARLLQQNLDIAFKDATIVTVTQRLEAARTADLILVLDRGAIVEQGAHDDLIAREGAYYQLMLSQAL